MNRRTLLALLAGTPLAGPAFAFGFPPGNGLAPEEAIRASLTPAWEAWKGAHLDETGRVIDRLQNNASHSEGQGYGMTIAERMGDEEAFDAMYRWTETNLAVRGDGLLAWRWLPSETTPVPDTNNASDGDLFYAWALMRAADQFGRSDYRARAGEIAQALQDRCVVDFPGHDGAYLFLPGAVGFEQSGAYVINPSYYMPRAMEELGRAFAAPRLATAAANGDVLLAEIARHGIMPDWLAVSEKGLHQADAFSPNSGYEAMRVPIWMVWSRKPDHPAVIGALAQGALSHRLDEGIAATVVDHETGEVIETSSEAGYRAVAALATCIGDGRMGAIIPPFDPAQTYYPATLHLFSYLAQIEVTPECFPV